jgi:single-strand DNA-binding protein
MSKDLNRVQVIGRLGRDPEMRYTTDGTAVTTFSVAAGRQWKGRDGEQQEETEWFKVVAWNKLAEVCNQYLAKGARVYVEGRLQTRKYTDRDGVERYAVEVVCSDMIMLDSRNAPVPAPEADDELFEEAPPESRPAPSRGPERVGAQPRTSAPNTPRKNVPQPLGDDDVPF